MQRVFPKKGKVDTKYIDNLSYLLFVNCLQWVENAYWIGFIRGIFSKLQ